MANAWENIQNRSVAHLKRNLPESINDLREKYFNNVPLQKEELNALKNFDNQRIEYLNAASNEEEFQKRYIEMQAKANLSPYKDFL